MTDDNYKYWSKSSVYLKALQDENYNVASLPFINIADCLVSKTGPDEKKQINTTPLQLLVPTNFGVPMLPFLKPETT